MSNTDRGVKRNAGIKDLLKLGYGRVGFEFQALFKCLCVLINCFIYMFCLMILFVIVLDVGENIMRIYFAIIS